jgi:hypothetical protein
VRDNDPVSDHPPRKKTRLEQTLNEKIPEMKIKVIGKEKIDEMKQAEEEKIRKWKARDEEMQTLRDFYRTPTPLGHREHVNRK